MATISVDVSGIVDGQGIDAADVTTPIANLKSAVEDTLNGVQAFDRISLGSAEALTISSGAVSPTKTHVTVDTEGAAAADDLDTINNGAAGRLLWVRCVNAGRVVTIKHGTGNVTTATGADMVLNSTTLYCVLIYSGTGWVAALMPNSTLTSWGAVGALTISSGAVTRTRTRHSVDTEGSAASDDLDTISGGAAGDVLAVSGANAARVVRVRDGSSGSGNIRLVGSAYRHLNAGSEKHIVLVYNGTNWVETMGAPGLPGLVQRGGNGWYERASSAAWASVGIAAGTGGGAGAVTASNDDEDSYVNQAIAATAGTFGGRRTSSYDLTRMAHSPIFECVLRTGSDITNVRYWVGLLAATPTNVDTLATSAAAFRYSTVAGDAGWVGACSTGSAQTVSASVGAIAAGTRYVLRVRTVPGVSAAYFSVNEGPEVAVTTNLPASSTALGACVLAITTTATAKNIAISRYGVWGGV
jgi:hypothetical protein